jgi:hypothetical protein
MDTEKKDSLSDKIIKLGKLLEELYEETNIKKFKDDSVLLEQWIWTLSDKKKKELGITLEGSATGVNGFSNKNES